MISGIWTRRQHRERGARRRMAIAFVAGVVIMAALSQTTVAADILSPGLNHESITPAPDTLDHLKPEGSPDTARPTQPPISELVNTPVDEAASFC